MAINMNPSARYVTQASLWSIQFGKPLTDRRITQLRKQGHYASPYAKLQAVEKKRTKRKLDVAKLFAGF
jgi:hypothetical protein